MVLLLFYHLNSLFEKRLVFLQFRTGRKINMVHFGVFIANRDNKTANQIFVNLSGNLNITTSNNSGNSGGNFFFLGFAQSSSGSDGDWGETGFSLNNSGVNLTNFADQSKSVVFSQNIEEVDNQWAEFEFGGDIVDDGEFFAGFNEWTGEKVGDFVVFKSTLESSNIFADLLLGVFSVGSTVESLGVVTSDSKAWDWSGVFN